jgi:hypothetical protein
MNPGLREAIVTLVTAVFVAGPLAAIALVATPAPWRGPGVLWGILVTVLIVVAGLRWRQRAPP